VQNPPEPFTISRGFGQWWRDSMARRGFWRTLSGLALSAYELLRDLTPARRRLRYGDLEYDWEHHVNTSWVNPAFSTRLREVFAGRQYQPSDPELFREVIGGLEMDYSKFTFIDLGSGKGRALLLACEFPFRRIIGVELLAELHAIADENRRQFQEGAQQHRIELWCGDARQFNFPHEPLVVFLFDPFPEHILEQVMTKLQRSVREQPRPVIVVYQNPVSEHVLSNAGWVRRIRGDIRAAVYEAVNTQ
jgi:SAM-dependent methyltransferase